MSEQLSWAELRRKVADQANGCCEYCRSQYEFCPDPFAVEHIVPKSRGGATVLDNLASSCQGCNWFKATKIVGTDPLTGTEASMFHPRLQLWSDHFAWSDDLLHIVGRTAAGRATVAELQLNRTGVVNLRRILLASGQHPP